MSFLITLTVVSLIAVGVLLLALVLVQKGRGSGTIFGPGSGHTVLGTKTAETLTWVTACTFGLFLLLAVVLNRMVG